MKRVFSQAFNTLLDTSGAMGVGLVDANGLVVHSTGAHGGLCSDRAAAHLLALQRSPVKELEPIFDDEVGEQVVMGRRYCYYLLAVTKASYLMYAMAGREVASGRVRFALMRARDSLEPQLAGQGLLTATRDRLEEPRQFQNSSMVRKVV